MKGAEGKLRSRLSKDLRDAGCFVQPIESSGTARGIPDLYLVADWGYSCWIELKANLNLSWPNARKIPFRPLQYHWLHAHHLHGGSSFVTMQFKNAFVTARIQDIDKETLKFDTKRPLLIQHKYNVEEYQAWLVTEMTNPI
jgi:hypothetical protein